MLGTTYLWLLLLGLVRWILRMKALPQNAVLNYFFVRACLPLYCFHWAALGRPRNRNGYYPSLTTLIHPSSPLPQLSTASFSGSVGKLYEIFNEMLVKMRSSTGQPSARASLTSPVLPLISSLVFRLHLLHPEHHSKLRRLQMGEIGLGMAESKLMHVETLRNLSLSEWPHNYEWVPKSL